MDELYNNYGRKGFFVTLEGVDGAGTTTVANALHDHFDDSVLSSEPTELWTGRQVRKCLGNDAETDALTDFYFFMGDRVHHVEQVVKPALAEGKTVISDRYADSTRAYQPEALVDSGNTHFQYSDKAREYIDDAMQPFDFEPDLTLWLDADIDDTFERTDGDEKYEQQESFQHRVHDNYEGLCRNNDRILRVDANVSEEEVVDTCIDCVEAYIAQKQLQLRGNVNQQ